jgi:DNA polymerase III epsilon subunit-like protein
MNETQFRDLTRKAMIREYIMLHQNTISIVDAANEIHGLVEERYDIIPELTDLLEKFDIAVDRSRL